MQRRYYLAEIKTVNTVPSRLKEAYFHWLVKQVRDPSRRNQRRTYWDLLSLMHSKEFVWLVPNDDNRIADGVYLRYEFLDGRNLSGEIAKEDFGPCSTLEVLIALSRRVEFQAGGSAEGWAWQLLDNLGLLRMSDPLSKRKVNLANQILEDLIWRQYQSDGEGGFFPLNHPPEDQTKVEIWAQMCCYVIEIRPDY